MPINFCYPMEIHVVRHTTVDFDKNKCYGRFNVPLAQSFTEEAITLKNKLSTNYDLVFSSPLSVVRF